MLPQIVLGPACGESRRSRSAEVWASGASSTRLMLGRESAAAALAASLCTPFRRIFCGVRPLMPSRMQRTDSTIPQPASATPPPAMPSRPVLGVPLALTDYERTLDWIDATVARARARATSASPPSTR